MTQSIELAVGVIEFEPDRGSSNAARTADLGDLELDAVRNVDAYAVLLAGGRALDRSALRLEHSRDQHAGGACLDVHFILDALEEWFVHGVRHGAKHPPVRGPRLGFLAVKNPEQRRALLRVCALIDDRLQLALGLEDRTGPRIQHCELQPRERHGAEMPVVDADYLETVAVPVIRPRLELAGTGVDAIAARELIALDVPVDAHSSFAT